MKSTENAFTYTERNGIFYPDLKTPKQTNYPIGKYGQLRLDFIKKHRRGTYTSLLVAFKLNAHLHEVDMEVHRMVDQIIAHMAQQDGTDERLIETDPMKWVGLMNNYRNCAEEIVLREVIYQ